MFTIINDNIIKTKKSFLFDIMKIKHNFNTGFIDYCQICNNKNIVPVIDLGHQPLADDLKFEKNKNDKIIFYPIKIFFCKPCRLLQNNYIVGDEKLYNKNYHYRPGISKTVVENQLDLAKKIASLYKLNKDDLIVDIGSNDGTLLNQFRSLGKRNVLGVEPTDTIKFQREIGIKSHKDFFNLKSSNMVKKKEGKAKIITTTNVFAHSNKMGDFLKGVKNLLDQSGVFIIENHYLLDVINKRQFDTFYHEHLRTYSLKSLIRLLSYYDFKILDAFTSERYGGNIQAHFVHKNNLTTKSKNVGKILNKELKLSKLKTYLNFKNDIDIVGSKLYKYLEKNKNKLIVAKSYPARASVIIHYYSFLKKYIKYIAEQSSSLKLNCYVPGTNIKIIDSKKMKKDKPNIIIVLAWHLFKPIHTKWLKKGLRNSKFIKPLPKLSIK